MTHTLSSEGADASEDGTGRGTTLRATKRGPYSDYYADQSTIVRRLTPLECERLQGYSDGWTDNGQADSARYRQLGNSVAVPVVEFIARRMVLKHDEIHEEKTCSND